MYTLSVSLAKAYLLSSMSVASCVDDDAKIGNNFENPIGVSLIFLPSTSAKIQRMVETELVQISPNRWSNWFKLQF